MVWQVKKICTVLVVGLVLIAATCGTIQAATHNVYENGNLGTTYITYFKDILSGTDIKNNYVAFRSGQNEYLLVVGDLEYNGNTISLVGEGKQYRYYTTSSNYNSQYYYDVSTCNSFSVDVGNSILYSDVGDFPELIERGAKFEILNTILLSVLMLSVVVRRIFFAR